MIEDLMQQTVTLRRISGETRDSMGSSTLTYTETTTTMYLEPRSGRENGEDRGTGAGEWLGVGRADVTFSDHDQIVYGSLTFDIVAPIRPFFDPRREAVSHVEMDLREVT